MADDESTNAPVDETNEDLDDFELDLDNLESEEQLTEDESSDEAEEVDDAEQDTDVSEDEPDAPDVQQEEVEQTEEEKAAAFRAEMYERRQAEKAQRQATIKEQQEAYLDEAQDDKDLALRQLQIDAYDAKVERNATNLTTSYERAIADFPELRDQTPAVQRRIDKAIDAFQAQYVKVDAYGNPTDVNGDMYAFLQSEAEDIRELSGLGARKQEASKGREKSKTFTAPTRGPKEPKVDPDLAAFDEEAYGS